MANLGAHLYRTGQLRQGIVWSERAWRAGNVMAGFNLGTIYLETGDTHRADLVWQKVAALGDADAMMCVARIALQRYDRLAAEKWIEPLLAQDQPYPITALGVAFRDSGDESTAMRIFDRAIALGDAYAMEYAANIHWAHGDLETATELRRRAETATRYGWGKA
jgi:TPR repeat protein